jgi:hypothetical protein
MFIEVDTKKTAWIWTVSTAKARLTHATAVIGYTSDGAWLKLADPHHTNTDCSLTAADSSGYRNDASGYSYSRGGEFGCVWSSITRQQLFASRDTKAGRYPVWF